jgi:hydrogenase maturation protein HypF
VLQNRRLATALLSSLAGDGFDVYINEQVPCNDGGISYGQAAVAAARTAAGPGNAPVTGPVEV